MPKKLYRAVRSPDDPRLKRGYPGKPKSRTFSQAFAARQFAGPEGRVYVTECDWSDVDDGQGRLFA